MCTSDLYLGFIATIFDNVLFRDIKLAKFVKPSQIVCANSKIDIKLTHYKNKN